jgi:predicted dehydrogenase
MRVAAIGYGYWGPNVVRNLEGLDGADLVWVCDVSEDNLKRASQLYPEAATTTDPDDALADDSVEAVVISTSAPTHHDLALRALRAGKHTFVEKPLTLDSGDARELIETAEQAGKTLMVGHLMQYHSGIDWVRDYIHSGELGDVLYMYLQRLNLGKVRVEENAFWSLAPHDVSIALYLLGEEPDFVSASGAAYVTPGVHDVVFANMHFPSGRIVNIHVSWLDPHKVRKLTVVGTNKMLVFDDMQATEKIWIYDKGLGEPGRALSWGEDLRIRFGDITVPWVQMAEPLAIELQHFLDCCTSGSVPRSDGRNGLAVVRVLEAVDESMEAGGAPVATGLAD